MSSSELNNEIEKLSFSDDEYESDDDDDEEDDEEEMVVSYHPITSPTLSFDTLSAAIAYDSEKSQFDILSLLKNEDPDTFFERAIVLVNKCRSFVIEQISTNSEDAIPMGHKLNEFLSAQTSSEETDMEFFKPVLEDDAYLFDLDELLLLLQSAPDEKKDEAAKEVHSFDSGNENAMLQMRISSLEDQLHLAKECILKLTEKEETQLTQSQNSAITNDSKKKKKRLESDSRYFSSYSHYSIHDTMLRDYVRTKSYEDAILHHDSTSAEGLKHNIFYDKVVLDVGCGTGILSLFAAKAGAKKVYALDGSKDIADCARKNILDNGYDQIISVVYTKVEEWVFPPGEEKVDIIISEWMGYALLFESMLPSVLYARDHFMKGKGIVYPNVARMYIEGASDDQLIFWDDVHGMKMQSMKRIVEHELTTEATVEVVPADKIVTDRCELISFNMNTVQDSDLDFKANFTLKGNGKVNKLVLSFDIDFVESDISFSTGCQTTPTHWKQTTLWLDSIVAPELKSENGEELRGTIIMSRNKDNERGYDFNIKWEVGKQGDDKARCDGSVKSTLTP